MRIAISVVAPSWVAVFTAISFISSAFFSGVAGAQATDSSGRQLDEIMVVAQKKDKAENLQDVPLAVSAFSGDELNYRFVQNLQDLSYSIPNTQLETVGTFPTVQNFSIRGQGINSSIPSVDPTVGTFVDGVYMGTTFGVVVDNWDLEGVEVLRGPQGLLFGRNVTGGAVLVKSARPDPKGEFGLKARAMGTDADRQTISAAIEGPIVQDVFAAKLMLYYDDDNGFYENINPDAPWSAPGNETNFGTVYTNPATGRDVGRLETKIARPSFVWQVTDALDMTLITEFGNSKGDGSAWASVTEQRDTGNLAEFTTSSDEMGKSDIDWTQVTFELNWNVGPGVLTNIAGWRKVDALSQPDVDGTFLTAFSAPGDTGQKQFSNELRWAGSINDMWDLTVGVFYMDQEINYREQRLLQVALPPVFPYLPTSPPVYLGLGGDMDATTYGIFWNNDIRFAEDWVVTAGIRYNQEDKDTQIVDALAGCASVGSAVNFDTCTFVPHDGDWDNWMPKLGLQWLFADTAQAYTYWTKGYRTGGFNFRNARPDRIPPGPTLQEEQNVFEVGLKSEVFDRRVRLNFAYFRNDIDDIQRELNVPDPAVVVLQGTVNAGDVTIKGVEFDGTWLVIDNLSFYGSVGYMDGYYTEKNPDYDDPNDPQGLYVGDDLPRLSPWSYSIGGNWDIPVGSFGIFNLRADYGVRDRNPYDDANLEYFETQKRLAASANWMSPENHWRVSLFGKNLTDQANWGNLTSIAGLYTAGPMQRGREVGLEVQYRL